MKHSKLTATLLAGVTILNILTAALGCYFYMQMIRITDTHAKQAQERLSAERETPSGRQVVVYKMYYDGDRSPRVEVDNGEGHIETHGG